MYLPEISWKNNEPLDFFTQFDLHQKIRKILFLIIATTFNKVERTLVTTGPIIMCLLQLTPPS